MSTALVYTRGERGMGAPFVMVESHLSNGLPKFHIVGLPETVVKESKDRVRCAILSSHFRFPSRVITVNLAPAELPKEGGRFDLAIALSILSASGQIPQISLEGMEVAGELSLTGGVRPVGGIISFALQTRKAGKILVLPEENKSDVCRIQDLKILPVKTLWDACEKLLKKNYEIIRVSPDLSMEVSFPDFMEVKGQPQGKRALELCASGGHNLLMVGPPGGGKTMLASRFPSILPPLLEEASIEVASVYSLARQSRSWSYWTVPPFRHPHHSASSAALIGGGKPPKPGEISLAHHGVLFLDELPEFHRHVLESLREPLESGKISLARANHHEEYPARFQLIAAMNPCPCGYGLPSLKQCQCSPQQVQRYRSKVSGPLLDRMDVQLEILPTSQKELLKPSVLAEENSQTMALRVNLTRQRQYDRQEKLNGHLQGKEIESFCALSSKEQQFLWDAAESLMLSNRGLHRILKVARTLADMEDSSTIQRPHLAESLGYRLRIL